MFRWVKRLLVIVPVLVALFFIGIFIYAKVINRPDPQFTGESLNDRLTAVATSPPAVAGDAPASTVTPVTAATAVTTAAPGGSTVVDGTWNVTSASEFGYRVQEVLAGVNTTATGRSNQLTGSLTIDATSVTAVDVTVDVASITSDDSRRDGQFAGRVMQTDRFPDATFTLTKPIELGAIPEGSEQIVVSASGDLTLHGITRAVTFDVTAQFTNDRIGVLGQIPITFADYGIANPSNGFAETGDSGLLEFELVFEQA